MKYQTVNCTQCVYYTH